ncbi:MAG TPA: hypothetical protein PK495_05075 [Bacteroidales bacterium]|nr:hypothetical protein [Bacteroidales bacterium]
MDYIVANHRFRIISKTPSQFFQRFHYGLPFLEKEESNQALLFKVILESDIIDWKISPQNYQNIKQLSEFEFDESICKLFSYDKGFLFRMDFKKKKKPLLMLSEENNFHFFTNYVDGRSYKPYEFTFALWIAYGLATVSHSTLALHASSIIHDNQAILFLGESGEGKSTQSRLWIEHVSNVSLLNDDSPIVRGFNENVLAYGSMWSGKTDCYKNEHYPLKAFVRIRQAKENTIKKLSALEAIAALYPSCPPMFAYNSYLVDNITATLSKIIKNVPVYILDCLPNQESVMLTYQALFNKNYDENN